MPRQHHQPNTPHSPEATQAEQASTTGNPPADLAPSPRPPRAPYRNKGRIILNPRDFTPPPPIALSSVQ
jgi:hypothetical protein